MAIKRLTDEEVGAIRFHAQNLLPTLCCPEGTAQCPRCQTLRGAFFLALEVQERRSTGRGVSISTVVLEGGLDDTKLQARPAIVDEILERQRRLQEKSAEPAEDATQEMNTVSPQD